MPALRGRPHPAAAVVVVRWWRFVGWWLLTGAHDASQTPRTGMPDPCCLGGGGVMGIGTEEGE